MNKVIIDKEYFDINSSKAAGLISGLKKLSQIDFSIEVSSKQFNDTLNKILHLEGITINDDKAKTENIFEIDSSGLVKKNENILNKKSPVKNLNGAIEIVLKNLRIELSLDGNGKSKISTGIGFFDHMLEQIARHSNINLNIKVKGDLHIDEHHTVEDTGLAMGEALREALGNKKGIKRYGFLLPMDDSIAQCTIDLGGRSYLNFKCKFDRNKVGEFPTELTEEFFRAISSALKANIYIRAKGKNDHHKIESIFKAFAKALNEACRFDERNMGILPSTKGML